MLKVKHLTLFKPKNWKKAGNLTNVARKIEFCSIYLQPSVAIWLDFNQNLIFYRMQVILGCHPHPHEESKCKNAQFLQWIIKDDDVYFKKITAS